MRLSPSRSRRSAGGTARLLFSHLVGALLAAAASVTLLAAQAGQPVDVGYIRPLPTPDPSAALIRAHGCWTQDAPVGVIPGHVVYDGRYLGPRATGQALDAVFGKPSPLERELVQAFCR